MKKSIRKRIFNVWTIGAAAIIVLALLYLHSRHSAAPDFQSTQAQIGDVVETVSVTGTVLPLDSADLAFQTSGVISDVYVSVGQAVKAGDKIASLDSANDAAALASAQATLADMSRSLTPQQLAVQETTLSSAQVSLANAQNDAVNAAHDAYVQAQGALVNYTDSFFSNPQSPNPVLNIQAQSSITQQSIDQQRLAVSGIIGQWSAELATASTSDADKLISDAGGYLTSIKSFMTGLAAIVNSLSSGNSGLAPAQIAADIATMNSGLTGLNAAISSVTSAQTELASTESGLSQAQSNYNLSLAGDSSDAIAAQAAKVAQADAQLSEDTIVSPIDGIVTQADPTVGEFAAAGQSGFAVQSDGQFKVEAYVPEADIAKVAVGDLASTTLNAYGSFVDFPTQVIMIDPAQTVLEGVPTYKVTLDFVAPDPRILSGMTANLEILTHEAAGVVEIPYRAVTITATSSTVRLVSADGKTYSTLPVITGLKGSDGSIQIVSGLDPGDKVVTYVAGQ